MFDAISNLNRIRELADSIKLIDISKFHNDHVTYDVVKGGCSGRGLLKEEDVAVLIAEHLPDTLFPEHIHHNNAEYVIMVTGELLNNMNGEEKLYKAGDCFIVPFGNIHSHYSKTGCKLIAITIPASEGYPHARK
jgi:quercetin dioxygenase-like cupin family protein